MLVESAAGVLGKLVLIALVALDLWEVAVAPAAVLILVSTVGS